MNPSLKRQLLKTFVQMVDDLKDPREIETFLTDFFNDTELEKYVRRISIAYWLKKGRDTDNIKRNLLASAKEIADAEKSLKKDGIKLALKKIEAEEWSNIWAERIKKLGVGHK
ncbi:MAG TPA: Trp family transcriptional regulator [Patescibacteria group bacterium]|nr:Trp family transcriptional regulator [Patescibacteria group bacterium]